MSIEELKPCPFCGAQPKINRMNLDERHAYANQVTVQCPSCGTSQSAVGDTSKPGYADNSTTEQRAIAAWNRRAAPAVGTVEKDAARWRETLKHVGGAYCSEGARFTLRYLPPMKEADIMKGSVAEHFTNAIDDAIEAHTRSSKEQACGS
jgi:Lar family restriction alleviation protein